VSDPRPSTNSRLYESLGDQSYGESITQNEHALQCAALAREAGATDAMIVAAALSRRRSSRD